MIATTESPYAGILTPDADLRQSLFGAGVMRHPAKQSLVQLTHIARRLPDFGIAPMSNILDCFGGAGSAMLFCAPSNGGHNVATIELAAHFRALQAKAWEHFSCTLDMADIYGTPPGVFVSLAGDSREIPLVLFAANHDMEYYPPSDDIAATNRAAESYQTHKDQAQYHAEIAEIDRRHFARQELLARFAETGLREDEQLDAIVTSPSYGGSEAVDKRKKQSTTIANHGGGNLARLRYDKDEIAKNGDKPASGRFQQISRMPKGTTRSNHGPHSQLSAKNGDTNYGADNIGNESGKKYLASMAQVWQGAAQVLRPGGILVCITRDCVKRGNRVPVGEQNRALIEAAGLTFLECETWKVDRLSFWRILQARKNPDAPIISTEEVMYFRKPNG